MREYKGNMFNLLGRVEVLCVTTNGFVKSNGNAVMGAGCAKTARDTFKGIDQRLGKLIKANGNVPQVLGKRNYIVQDGVQAPAPQTTTIVSFPTKHNWMENADVKLIRESAIRLVYLANVHGWKEIYLPRPGVGNGRLEWETPLTTNGRTIPAVKPVLEEYLDDRFIICSFPERKTEVVVLDANEKDTTCTDLRDRYSKKQKEQGYTDTSVGKIPNPDGLTKWLNTELRVGTKLVTIQDVQNACTYWAEFKCGYKGHCNKCPIVTDYNAKFKKEQFNRAKSGQKTAPKTQPKFSDDPVIKAQEVIDYYTKRFKYKNLPLNVKERAIKVYEDALDYAAWDKNETNVDNPLYVLSTKISTGFTRIVIGDYGPFVEISPEQIIEENIFIPKSQEYRTTDDYKDNVKYFWFTTKQGGKIYYQQKGVKYADYKPGYYYISPFQVLEEENEDEAIKMEIEANLEKVFKEATKVTPKQKFLAVLKRYKKMTVKELKNRAKQGGLEGYSQLRKKELIRLIMESNKMKQYIMKNNKK